MQFGPVLILREAGPFAVTLATILVREGDTAPEPIEAEGRSAPFKELARIGEHVVWRAEFALTPDRETGYRFEGVEYPVSTEFGGDLRIAFVSCNGEEDGDLDRDSEERNLMWLRLLDRHHEDRFQILLHGGDQVYADEVTNGHRLTDAWPDKAPPSPEPGELETLRDHLRLGFLHRYAMTYAAPGFDQLGREVPSLMVWDDHDICDGWGSLGPDFTGSQAGQMLFECAREAYLLYQHGCTEDEIDKLFLDPTGSSLSWRRDFPGVSIIAPDLRSERTKHQVMAETGWAAVSQAFRDTEERVLLISSVPLLGPRLSLFESLLNWWPGINKYEDDLRDQWQSRAHREEWKRMLRQVIAIEAEGPRVTALSGEIHLATRATLAAPEGAMHQLVASGISHRAPPSAWAGALSLLARLGEAPLSKHPIRIHPLPGQRKFYCAERNFLVLERRKGAWRAFWSLEDSGDTPWLDI
ncbi:alkaline phosphatase D family protein [Litorisediminicola beolgyonensis]|uniref:Alkaline phosphatase D family protein n=1 Tax=Litorisediminicola beolgyonensis TaxID=1173614 RepID=A0ABW3ZHS5_9RHOB